MESVDSVAVDILSRPQVIVVRLVRTLAIHDNSMLHASNSFDDYMGRAVFWPTNDRTSQPGHRTLWGELHLKKGLKPSVIVREISLQVRLLLRLLCLSEYGCHMLLFSTLSLFILFKLLASIRHHRIVLYLRSK